MQADGMTIEQMANYVCEHSVQHATIGIDRKAGVVGVNVDGAWYDVVMLGIDSKWYAAPPKRILVNGQPTPRNYVLWPAPLGEAIPMNH